MRAGSRSSFDTISSELHEVRLAMVVDRLRASGATSVVDLGCGGGALLVRLAMHDQFQRIVGIDNDQRALAEAQASLQSLPADRRSVVELHYGSFASRDLLPEGVDAATLVETIEHIDPRYLSRVEQGLFRRLRPQTVLVTTPNRDYNTLLGLGADEVRHADHHFEWSREKFRRWAVGLAERHGYAVVFIDIGRVDPVCGGCTQMAHFTRDVCDAGNTHARLGG